jgi:hypothetical protein
MICNAKDIVCYCLGRPRQENVLQIDEVFVFLYNFF